jgi:hypothetical protein
MEELWFTNMKNYKIGDVKNLPCAPLSYFRDLMYARNICFRPHIQMRIPFSLTRKYVKMSMELTCLTHLLDQGRAELIFRAYEEDYDLFLISLPLEQNSFILYSFFIYEGLYIGKVVSATKFNEIISYNNFKWNFKDCF